MAVNYFSTKVARKYIKHWQIIFVLDGSRSMNKDDWGKGKDFITRYVEGLESFHPRSTKKYSLIQYGTQVETLKCVDKKTLFNHLKSLKKMGGDSNLSAGIGKAIEICSGIEKYTEKCVFFFSTGNSMNKISTLAEQLKKEACVYSVKTGNNIQNRSNLNLLSTYGSILDNFENSYRILKFIEDTDFDQHKVIVKAEIIGKIRTGQDLQMRISITNQEQEIKKFELEFSGDDYFYWTKVLFSATGKETSFEEVTLRYKNGASIESFPMDIIFNIKRDSAHVADLICSLGTEHFKDDYGEDPCNILLFGLKGVGKSSLINTIYTSLDNGSEILTLSKVGTSSDHITTVYDAYVIPEFPFKFFDIWGSEDDLFDETNLIHFLEGKIQTGTNLEEAKQKSREPGSLKQNQKTMIHVVAVVLEQSCLNGNHDTNNWRNLRKYIQCIRGKNIPITVIITFMDEIDSGSVDLMELKIKAGNLLGIGGSIVKDVVLHSNYTTQTKRDFNIDSTARTILLKFKHSAMNYKKRKSIEKEVVKVNADTITLLLRKIPVKSNKEEKKESLKVSTDLEMKYFLKDCLKSFSKFVFNSESKKKFFFAFAKIQRNDKIEFLHIEDFESPLGEILGESTTLIVYVDSGDPPFSNDDFVNLDHIVSANIKFGSWEVNPKLIEEREEDW